MVLSLRIAALSAMLALAMAGLAQAQTGGPQHHVAAPSAAVHQAGHGEDVPTLPGQDAFGAVQEILAILEADPHTDWSRVDLEALRQHLTDMNEVTLHAAATSKQIDGGIDIAITGSGRTLLAIQRMVPAWAQTMNGHLGWHIQTDVLPDGERLTVTAADPKEIAHIRGLGFIGLIASGSHHQPHHLAIARGDMPYTH